jgi:hypothetical protein
MKKTAIKQKQKQTVNVIINNINKKNKRRKYNKRKPQQSRQQSVQYITLQNGPPPIYNNPFLAESLKIGTGSKLPVVSGTDIPDIPMDIPAPIFREETTTNPLASFTEPDTPMSIDPEVPVRVIKRRGRPVGSKNKRKDIDGDMTEKEYDALYKKIKK